MPTPEVTYDPNQTYIVDTDTVGNNFLVRGNLPILADGTFAYNELNAKLQSLIGDTFNLSAFTVMDISLIDNQGELPSLECEFDSFQAGAVPTCWTPYENGILFNGYGSGSVVGDGGSTGGMGSLMWTPVQGCEPDDQCPLIEPSQYDFNGVVTNLKTLMDSCDNTVIYIHCMNGHDRAGSLTCGYQMKYLGISMEEAMAEGVVIMGHGWHHPYKNLIEWYASTLPQPCVE